MGVCLEPPQPARNTSARMTDGFTNLYAKFQCLTVNAMIRFPILVLAATVLMISGCSQSADPPKKALSGGTLIDGTGSPAVPNAVIVIDGGRVLAAGPETTTKVPDGFERISANGKFIVPGLIDAHIKIVRDADGAAAEMKAFLAAGITSVGADGAAPQNGPRVFGSGGNKAGFADLVVASNGTGPEATLAKIERLAKAEISAVQIIQATTQTAAAWLGQPDLGTIQAGKKADLVVLNADPTANVKNLRQVYRVMKDGHWVNLK